MRGKAATGTIKSYIAQKQWKKAIDICQQTLNDNPNQSEVYRLWGKALVGLGRLTEAIDIYQKLLVNNANEPKLYAEIGLLYSKQQKLAEAVWQYEKALALKPEWVDLQYNLAVILHQLEDWEKAIAGYQKTIALQPNYVAAYFNLGVLYDQRGELQKAIVNYHQVLKLQPNNTKAYSNLGSSLVKQEKFADAIKIYQQGLKLDPTWAVLYNNLGQALWLNQQPDKALDKFEKAIVLEPSMALAHYNLGKLWQQQRNYSAAIDCFQKVIKLEPNNIWAYSHCSEALFVENNLELAIDYWRTAISIQPNFVLAYCQRAKLLQPESLLEKAKISCANFLNALDNRLNYSQILTHLWQTYFYWGDVLFTYGGITQAQVYYQKALQIKPQEVELYLRLGNCLAKQKKLNEAIIIYQMGLTLQPNHPQICFQIGKVLEQKQQVEQAIDYYETVCQQPREDSKHNWEQLPNFCLSNQKLIDLPQGIYPRTIDWVRDSNLEDFEYFHFDWSSVEVTTTARSRKFIESPLHRRETTVPAVIGVPRSELTVQKQSESSGEKSSQGTSSLGVATIIPPSSSPVKNKCGGVNCAACMGKLISYFEPVQIGKQAYKCSLPKSLPIDSPSPFVVKISAGRAWITAQKNSWLICNAIAIITPDNYLLGDLSRYYPWYLPGCTEPEKTDHPIFGLETIPPLEKISGKVAVLSGLAGHVYYHWMIDILPKIDLLRRSGIDLEEIDWFIVNNIDRDFQTETLEFLDIPAAKIKVSDRHSYIEAEELIVPSFPGHLDWVPKSTIKFLRQTFLKKIDRHNSQTPKRIYISRSQARGRLVINEDQVIDLVSQFGFQTIVLEKLSVLEQISLFANAEAIISPHGSSLTNLVFCNPSTVVIELFSPNYVRTDYWMISQQLQLQHYYVLGDGFDCLALRNLMYQNSLTEDILVNINSFQKTLEVSGLTN